MAPATDRARFGSVSAEQRCILSNGWISVFRILILDFRIGRLMEALHWAGIEFVKYLELESMEPSGPPFLEAFLTFSGG